MELNRVIYMKSEITVSEMTVTAAANMIGVSRARVHGLIYAGRIQARQLDGGKLWAVDYASAKAFRRVKPWALSKLKINGTTRKVK